MIRTSIALIMAVCFGIPAFAQSLPPDLVGTWNISSEACAASSTSITQIDVSPGRIETFGGNAIVREVKQIGPATFVAGDFQQIERVADVSPRMREHFRFSRHEGPDRIRFVWMGVRCDDLVRCGTVNLDASAPATPAVPAFDGHLPIPMGLWVVAGESCRNPSNASWRVYDGAGLRSASSERCEIDATVQQGSSILFSQLCTPSYDGLVQPTRDRITITAPRRFTLVESDERPGQDFNWCGPELYPRTERRDVTSSGFSPVEAFKGRQASSAFRSFAPTRPIAPGVSYGTVFRLSSFGR